jgi:tetratricopeptide (TPR) repeat protein
MKPISSLAEGIASAYLKMNNKPKYIEWTETAIKLPENDANFTLRLNLVHTYLEEPKNYPKIMEWAQAALKAAALVQIPSRETQAQLKEVRHFCHDIIGKILLDQDKKFPEAIKAFKQALKVKEYAEGYYFIGICLQSQKKDDAMSWYAKTELWCEKNDKDSKECKELAPKAKANLELIYEKLHDGSTDTRKEYIKAKEKDKIENYWTSEEN